MARRQWTETDKDMSQTLTLVPARRVVQLSWALHPDVGHVTDIRGGGETWSFDDFLTKVEEDRLSFWRRRLPEICAAIRAIKAAGPPK